MKKMLLGLFCLLSSIPMFASHFSGGELRYEFNGTNYTIHLALYNVCQTGSSSLPSTSNVTIASTAASFSSILTLPLISRDTISPSCPSTLNACYTTSSSVPGFIVARYSGTITLPSQQTDWIFSFIGGARSQSSNIMSGNMYLEATLDNTIAINSNAWIPTTPTYYITANTTANIPMQAVDAEGDNLVYDLIVPQQGAGMNSTYNAHVPPFTASTPFGSGTYTINPTTQTLTLMSQMAGPFSLAFRVKEYRNSVLIGTYIRDFSVMVLPGSVAFSYPVPASYAPFTVYTCPGQIHSMTVNFTDPVATDSVYINVTTPSLPGFTFTSSVAPAPTTGSASISWTTPASMNPATLPFFYIKLRVRDNACPRAVADFAIIVRTKQCTVDSVWPGDANGDFTVNIYDPLAIAIANGQTGAARTSPSTTWTAQACTPWANSFVTNSVNMKHADCDGNGTVNLTDLGAITTNYGLTHPKESGEQKQTAGPELYFDLSGIQLKPGNTVNIPIMLGNATNTMIDFYGLATRISASGTGSATVPATVASPITWLGTSTNTLSFTKSISTNIIDWAHSRTDHQNTTGHGQVGVLTYTVPTNAVLGSAIKFRFNNTKMIDKDGMDITAFNPIDGEGFVPMPVNVSTLPGVNTISVVPNPAHNVANMHIALANNVNLQVRVVDMIGKTVYERSSVYEAGNHTMALPAQQLAAGMYTIHVSGEGWNSTPAIKWIKQ